MKVTILIKALVTQTVQLGDHAVTPSGLSLAVW